MKVNFSHQLHIEESHVFEVLALMMALARSSHDDRTSGILDLTPFEDIQVTHAKTLSLTGGISRLNFNWLEFALVVHERHDIDGFFSAVKALEPGLQQRYFFGLDITLEEAHQGLKSFKDMEKLFETMKIPKTPTSDLLIEGLLQFDQLLESYRQIALDIASHPAFKAQLSTLSADSVYASSLAQFTQGTMGAGRHPLSYAQELMGKPFWNIADYSRYEFIPVYFMSPFSIRFMDGETMIYVQGLNRLPKADLETPEQLGEALKVIADSTRLKILSLIHMKPMYGKQIADQLGLTTPTVSHHLEVLRLHGLVNMEQDKQIKYFSANFRKMQALSTAFTDFFKS